MEYVWHRGRRACGIGGAVLYFFFMCLVVLAVGLQILFLWENKQIVIKRVIHTAYGVLPTSNPSRCTMLQKGLFYADTEELGCFDRARKGCASPETFSVSLYTRGRQNVAGAPQASDSTHPNASVWWQRVKEGIRSSRYFVEDPRAACVLVPSFDHTLASTSQTGVIPYQIAKRLRQVW